jgi:hypothetical protein
MAEYAVPDTLSVARSLVARGWSVIPLRPGQKTPALPSWKELQDRLPTDQELVSWWGNGSRHGIALVTGERSAVVIDLDGPDAAEKVRARGLSLERTVAQQTGGGGHQVFYAHPHPGTPVPNRADLLGTKAAEGWAVDVRGDGGYVCIPPSVHPSGRAYAWLPGFSPDEITLAPLPEHWRELLDSPPAPAASPAAKPLAMKQTPTREALVERVRAVVLQNLPKFLEGLAVRVNKAAARRGGEIEAHCPLPGHEDSMPSWRMNTVTGLWKCFGCNREGDLFTLYQELRHVDFPTALAELAATYAAKQEKETQHKAPGHTIDYLTLATTEPKEIEWVIDGLLPRQTVNFLCSDAGVGKTWLSLVMGHAVASGRPWLGHFPTRPGRVLHFDEESAPVLLHNRIALLRRAESDLPTDLPIRYRLDTGLQVDSPEGLAMLIADVKEYTPSLVIIDSFRACFSGDENKSHEVRVALANLHHVALAADCAILLLHHTRKISQTSNASSQMLRGSTDLRGAVDNHVFLRVREPGSLLCEHEKSRWAPPVGTFGIQLVAGEEGVSLHYIPDVNPEADKVEEAKLAILGWMEGERGPVDRPALLARVKSQGISTRTAERAIAEMEESRVIVRAGRQGRRVLYERSGSVDLALL